MIRSHRLMTIFLWSILLFLGSRSALAVSPDSAYTAREFVGFGKDELKQGQFIRALVSFNEALSLDPDLVDAWLGRGHAAAGMGHLEDALDASAHALALEPGNREGWTLQAGILFNQRQFEAALVAIDKSISLGSDSSHTWNNKGQVLDSLGRHDEAAEAYKVAQSKTVVVPVTPYKGGITRMTHSRRDTPPPPKTDEDADSSGRGKEGNR
jgi:tetratricopeptide (TPR) repeat protein